jgi:ferritin-like metal-binding protein YciE
VRRLAAPRGVALRVRVETRAAQSWLVLVFAPMRVRSGAGEGPDYEFDPREGSDAHVADLQARDVKLIQYLNEAYGKEKQLETALQAHITMTTRAPYKKRLQQHLKETKGHSREVERRIKKLGGTAEAADLPGPDAVSGAAAAVQNVANRAAALAQGPMHALRGTGEQERMLKNARTQLQDEAEEIGTYTMIQTLAETVGDKDTAQIAKKILREEYRMREFLLKLIPQLTKAVAQEEIPAAERRSASSSRKRSSSSSSRSSSGGSSSGGSSSRGRGSSSSSGSSSSRSRSGGSSSSRAKSSGSSKSSGSRSSGSSKSSSSRSSGSRASSARSGSSRSSGSSKSSGSRASSSRSKSSRSKSS